jgi:hypothetical protein
LSGQGQFTLPDGSPFAFDVFANAATQANQIDAKAPKASPILTGEPKSVTFLPGVSNTTIATTAFVAEANAGVSAYTIYTLNLYASYANAVIQPLDANVASYQTWANANLAIANISINNRANIASPTFTGAPKSVTFLPGVSNTTIATTAFVFEANSSLAANVSGNLGALRRDLINNYAPIVGPNFTGFATSDTTATPGNNSNQIANTGFVFEANTGSVAFLLDRLQANNISHSANVTAANVQINSQISSLQANVTAANVQISSLRANITAANTAIDSVTTAWTANAGTQQTQIDGLQASITAANISHTANVTAANSRIDSYTIWANANISAQSYNPVFSGQSLSITSGNVIQYGGNATTWNTGVKTASSGEPGDVAGQFKFNYAGAASEVWVCIRNYDSGSSTDPIWVQLSVAIV